MNQIDYIKEETTGSELSIIKDPFMKDCIGDIHIFYRAQPISFGTAKPYWSASVKFQNGLTQGEQKTPNCKDFEELIAQLKLILNSVRK